MNALLTGHTDQGFFCHFDERSDEELFSLGARATRSFINISVSYRESQGDFSLAVEMTHSPRSVQAPQGMFGVIVSVAIHPVEKVKKLTGLPRRFSPRNDENKDLVQ